MPNTFIPYGRQALTAADIQAVTRVLKSPFITQGPEVERFERAFAKAAGARHAVAVSSGTAGLHLAALAAGFGPGDEVVTSPMSFVATANCILYTGAKPVFADINPETGCLDPAAVQKKVGRRTRGIISVHFAGYPSELKPKKNLILIEDACHALGARFRSRADMRVFSFHPVKHITTGEGGMITTDRKDFYDKLKHLRTHGIEKDASRFIGKKNAGKPWFYEMQALGFNYRITDFQCALGTSQLARLGSMVRRRRQIAAFYARALKGIEGLALPSPTMNARSSFHLYVAHIDFKRWGKPREWVMKRLREKGIGTQVHYIPIPEQPFYKKRCGNLMPGLPNCRRFYEGALSIPMFSSMTDADCRRVVRAVREIAQEVLCR